MKLTCKKKNLLNIKLAFIIMLLAICMSMNILLLGKADVYYSYEKITDYEVKSVAQSEPVEGDPGHISIDNTSYLQKPSPNKGTFTKKALSIFIDAALSNSTCLNIIFVIFCIILNLSLFISLPDDWTLINQKVRLDD